MKIKYLDNYEGTFPRKVYLELVPATEDDFLADRERILRALGSENIRFSLGALRKLYPTLIDAEYQVTITLNPSEYGWDIIRVEKGDTTDRLYAIALDIGSTTLEMEMLDLQTGRVITNHKCSNGQAKISDNILDRIIYAKDHAEHLAELQSLVVGNINELLELCCKDTGITADDVAMLVIAGNTTMIHFLMGCEPWLVFQTPYAPAFFDPGIYGAEQIGIRLRCNVYCIPAVANYLGGDIVSGLLLTDIAEREDPAIFLDIGTNGELALGCKDFILVGAGAAGPALEGAVSRFGMRAETGAVSSVKIVNNKDIEVKTIGDTIPKGICGSGIVELLSEAYLSGWINSDGSVNLGVSTNLQTFWDATEEREIPAIIYAYDGEQPLFFTETDIHEFLKCKAAAFTMVATLLDYCGISPEDVGMFYLSGGFGTHYDIEAAVTIGMYPDISRDKFKILGNSALDGAKKLLCDSRFRSVIEYYLANCTYVQFGAMERFLENMTASEFIPHTDLSAFPSVKRRI